MKRFRVSVLAGILAASTLVLPTAARCQSAKMETAADHLATVKVGHWIQLEATVQQDSSARCTEIRLLTGDFLDDDWSLRGILQAIAPGRREFTIGGIRVQVTETTIFESPKRTLRGFSDLRLGMLVEVEGTYSKDLRILAAEVDDESDEIARRPWSKDQIRIVGKVERVDARKRLLSAMGREFRVSDKTRLRSVIR